MNHTRTYTTALMTLSLIFGLQTFRVLPVPLVWYYGALLAYNPNDVALLFLPLPVLIALAPLVQRALGGRRMALLAAAGLAFARLAIQIAAAPAADLALAIGGLVMLSWLLLTWSREGDARSLAIAWPSAILLDTTSRSLLVDYDLAWRTAGWAEALTAGLAVALIVLAWLVYRRTRAESANMPPPAAALLGIGPWLFLVLNFTQNAPALMAVTGWADTAAHGAIVTLTALALCASAWARPFFVNPRARILVGLGLVAAMALLSAGAGPDGLWSALAMLCAWLAIGMLLCPGTVSAGRGLAAWRSSIALALAWIIAVALFLLDTIPPWANLVAAVLLGALVIATARRHASALDRLPLRRMAAWALPVWLIAVAWALLDHPPQPASPSGGGGTLRVMTYNIHHGTDAGSRMDLQGIADAIAAEQPDVVALNEVSRGFISTGYVDTLWLISRRLGMPYVLGLSHTGGRFGNALLSRYPIRAWSNTPFEHLGAEVRGVLSATLDTPLGNVTFYATHLDHRPGPVALRAVQAQEMLSLWDGRPRAILLGDMNARPDEPDLRAIYAAGFTDVLRADGQEDAYTFWNPQPAPGPRFDYIFLTPDLTVRRAWVPQTRASDHLPVVADVQR